MAIRLFSITSELHSEMAASARNEEFIISIEKELGEKFIFCETNARYDASDSVIYVRTGGTENIFRNEIFAQGIPESAKVRLLTSGHSNSLAASMEILSFLNNNGINGEILHGSATEIAGKLRSPADAATCDLIRRFDKPGILSGRRYGVIGHPSDWLISSSVDYKKARRVLGCELVDIDIKELTESAGKKAGRLPECLEASYPEATNPFVPKFGKDISRDDFNKAAAIYEALKSLAMKYRLDGLTVRCFDLLTAIGSTSCIALAVLNSEGLVAACEGDVPAMLSMAICRQMTGESGFQVNLSRVREGRMLFAHCTVPLSMVGDYCIDTHFESGIGLAIHGEFKENSKASIFKLGADLEHCVLCDAEILSNQYEDNLCRTQVWINSPGLEDYLLNAPLGNHHIICPPFSL